MKAPIRLTFILLSGSLFLAVVASLLLWLPPALAQELGSVTGQLDPEVIKWGYIAAVIATGISSLGAAYAVATVGSAAIGAVTEKPELFGRLIILVGLAEGIAIYGLIVSILIINQLA